MMFKVSLVNFAVDISLAGWRIDYTFGKNIRQMMKKPCLYFTAKETTEQNLSFPPSPKVVCSFPTVSGCWSRYTHNLGDNSLRFKLPFSKPAFPNNASSTFEMRGEILPPLSKKGARGLLYWTKEMEKSTDSTSNLQYPWGRKIVERVFSHMKSNEEHNIDYISLLFGPRYWNT